jgi:hypothetical protein
MTNTLGQMKTDIARDLGTANLTSEIAAAITRAIEFYQSYPFYFNESREQTFTTVVDQVWYSSSPITLIKRLDSVILEESNYDQPLTYIRPEMLELLTDGGSSSAEPYQYTYYNQQLGIFPKPDDTYTVRLFGTFLLAEPASDIEATNGWMNYAFNLIRAHAAAELAAYKLRNYSLAEAMRTLEMVELKNLNDETVRRLATGRVRAMNL